MTHLEFLRSPSIVRMISRAGKGAGVPVSVHYVKRNQEGLRVCGWGQCEACRVVSTLPGGTTACRLSRTTASTMAIRQKRPVSFVCHLGLACVSIAPFAEEGYVVTLGPFCPTEEQRSLASDVEAGFAALNDNEVLDVPYTLDDITRLPAGSVPAIAEWLLEGMGEAWADVCRDSEVERTTPPQDQLQPTVETETVHHDTLVLLSRDLGAALAAEQFGEARSLLLGHLEEFSRGAKGKNDTKKAHIAAVVGATLEVLAGAGLGIEGAQQDHGNFIARLTELDRDTDLVDQALGVFGYLRRKEGRISRATSLPHYPELYAVIKEHLLDGVTLEYVATVLEESPSAISHRLKRKFGMSFSEYVGRIRIEKAKSLIRETQLSATEIARRVGIADQSNFGKLFKKFSGQSPANYRKDYGKRNE